ncbi:MAG TPA: ATP-binding protein [Candidatus Cloacimonadota bacterium]|nr:ATP-binding protein [Candidatus Cloacimonadota bacterium]
MKQGKLITTANVVKADRAIAYLQRRPKLELVGLGLVYGKPGLGKSTWASRTAFSRGYIYLRLESTTTPKNFAQRLLYSLANRYNYGNVPTCGATNTIFKRCMAILENHEDAVIIVDEIDYAFSNKQLLGAIRDIVDETLAIVILVGMQNAKEKLLQVNEYYFDRCNVFCEFSSSDKKDVSELCRQVMDKTPNEAMKEMIYRESTGNLRRAVKLIYGVENAIGGNQSNTSQSSEIN